MNRRWISRIPIPLAPLVLALATAAWPARAGRDWWLAGPNPRSDKGLLALVDAFYDLHGDQLTAVPVRGARLVDQAFELTLVEGTLFAEPPIAGHAAVYYFEGQATLRFAPSARTARLDLEYWFGQGRQSVTLTARRLLFASFRTRDLPRELSLDPERAAPRAPADAEGYAEIKKAFRQLGTKMPYLELNRRGPSRGAFYVIAAAEEIRHGRSGAAHVLYAVDPTEEKEVRFDVLGRADFVSAVPWKDTFLTAAAEHSRLLAYRSPARIERYGISVRPDYGRHETEETTRIVFSPAEGLAALRLALTPRLQIERVTDADGRELPFLQWEFLDNFRDIDRAVLVDVRPLAGAAPPQTVRIEARGKLFETVSWLTRPAEGTTVFGDLGTLNLHLRQMSLDEDDWFPRLEDPRPCLFDVSLRVPKKRTGAAPGRLVRETVEDKERILEFRTEVPRIRTTMYFGDYRLVHGKADDLPVTLYVNRGDPNELKRDKYILTEIENATREFSRILRPLKLDVLRAATVPGFHGRGFDGVLLLSGWGAADTGTESQVFRAHEVAHQWWGNIVDGRDWPEDRWISESFAEYMAMEYHRVRENDLRAWRDRIERSWIQPLRRAKVITRRTLLGEKLSVRAHEDEPLSAGSQLVYTKGPLVIHMLRYLFRVRFDSDEPFWQMLRDLLGEGEYRRVSTEELRRHAEKALGMSLAWFWDQWIYGTEIPTVSWHARQERTKDGWKVIVEAEQQDTEFRLLVPVYVDLKGKGVARRPLLFDGRTARTEIDLPKNRQPRRIELNRYFKALVELEER